jgi:hypothetical protein
MALLDAIILRRVIGTRTHVPDLPVEMAVGSGRIQTLGHEYGVGRCEHVRG